MYWACLDSDYLYLNLIDTTGKVNAWAGIGSGAFYGIRRRTNLSAWKKKVADFPRFRTSVRKKYVFAEDALLAIAQSLGLSETQSAASYEYRKELDSNKFAAYLYFKLPDALNTKELPKLVPYTPSLMPCFLNQPSIVTGINVGGKSSGLSVYFVGSYVEHEEITFSDVCLVICKYDQMESIPLDLKKIQLSNGQWAYYHHEPNLKIPPKIDEQLPPVKQEQLKASRCITVRFTPHGNSKKILDITVILVPDRNPAGQVEWNVWHPFGSKAAFIQFHNTTWSKRQNCDHLLLRAEDFDG